MNKVHYLFVEQGLSNFEDEESYQDNMSNRLEDSPLKTSFCSSGVDRDLSPRLIPSEKVMSEQIIERKILDVKPMKSLNAPTGSNTRAFL